MSNESEDHIDKAQAFFRESQAEGLKSYRIKIRNEDTVRLLLYIKAQQALSKHLIEDHGNPDQEGLEANEDPASVFSDRFRNAYRTDLPSGHKVEIDMTYRDVASLGEVLFDGFNPLDKSAIKAYRRIGYLTELVVDAFTSAGGQDNPDLRSKIFAAYPDPLGFRRLRRTLRDLR